MSARTCWVDASSGVSGDMLLGSLADLGVVDVADVVARLALDADVSVQPTRRGGLRAVSVTVQARSGQPHRHLADLIDIVDAASLPEQVRQRATSTLRRLAAAEARVHGVGIEDVQLHEVGAVDTVVDVVGACSGLAQLGVDRLVVGPVAVGGGRVVGGHGELPVPVPAVVELLHDTPLVAVGGPVEVELATPTGVALLAEWADASGPLPAMTVSATGVGAGSRELDGVPNVLRLLVGTSSPAAGDWQLLECNVDDLDPRLWPGVIDRLLAAGAVDAWLTPIVMKKGRPAHTLSVLAATAYVDAVTEVVFTESSTIGVRGTLVTKRALDREWIEVDVEGQPVRVKVARSGGDVVNASPEFDDVARAAAALNRPAKSVLSAAIAAAQTRIR